MKKLIGTSGRFEGEIVLLYNDDRQLVCIDLAHATLEPEQVNWLKQRTPVVFDNNFLQHFGVDNVQFTEESFKVTFEMFWEKYNKKINRKRCERVWDRLFAPAGPRHGQVARRPGVVCSVCRDCYANSPNSFFIL